MPDNALPARNNPVVSTFFITMALAAAVLTGASLTGAADGTVQDWLHDAGFGRTAEFMAEQRRQAQVLENIELTVVRARADLALLSARISEAENVYQGVLAAAPVSLRPRASSQISPDFDLGALRASLDAEMVTTPGPRGSHLHPRKGRRGAPDV